MTREEALKHLDTILTVGEQVDALEMAIEALKEQRPHGKWVFKYDNPLIKMGYWECSNCNQGRLMVEENFCPNCGADMRSKKEGVENDAPS